MKDPHDQVTADLPQTDPIEHKTPAKRGRPAKHENAAARQKAYRERLKEQGLREVKRYVLSTEAPLSSGVIDLSEVRPWSHG